MSYDHENVEKKWIKKWEDQKLNEPDLDQAEKPYFNLMMFPYPSAEGLHVGNMYAFTGSDIWGRLKRMQGNDVFEPIGLDGFGIHSENYAIKIKEHIREVSQRTEKHYYEQLHMVGGQFDWSRTVESYKPEYYKWTQWLFIQMYNNGLVDRKKQRVNWCPSCKTVLSDEQVIDEHCERCDSEVDKKDMEQWFWKITDYAERLLKNLEWINWSEDVKIGQRNWIGKKVGINIEYGVEGLDEKVVCFTTRPDTNFGATFIVAAPDSDFVKENLGNFPEKENVKPYIKESLKKSDIERIAEGKKKTGEFTGLYAINGLNKRRMPIYVSDFVLANVGTGCVVGVPGHDIRDFEFAQEKGIEIIRVVIGSDGDESPITKAEQVQEDEGKMVNSEFLDGMDIHEATKKIMDHIEENSMGKRTVSYKLRDWCVSRQRYWGAPIPMIYCDKCGWQPVPEKDLPVLLPDIKKFEDILPDGSGVGPLGQSEEFKHATCPKCKGNATRETDVMDPFVDSSWYFLRYASTEFDDKPFDKERLKKWYPIDMYIGGKEHTVLHLLYTRFVTMALYDQGHLEFEEPFERFFGHGLLIKEGKKMSKSKGNIINPDEYIGKYGADAVRMYLMFLGDFSQGGDWRDTGMKGMHRFINKVWKLFEEREIDGKGVKDMSMIDRTIAGIEKDIERLRYNTAIAKIMEFINWYVENEKHFNKEERKKVFKTLALVMAPFAPFITEEMWTELGNEDSVHNQEWPSFDEKLAKGNEVTIAVQINGKTRDTIMVPSGASQERVEKVVKNTNAKKYLEKGSKKVIFVEDRIINYII